MKLTMEMDLDKFTGDPADEAGRILRYWAGAMKEMNLEEATRMPLMDSDYAEVGRLEIH